MLLLQFITLPRCVLPCIWRRSVAIGSLYPMIDSISRDFLHCKDHDHYFSGDIISSVLTECSAERKMWKLCVALLQPVRFVSQHNDSSFVYLSLCVVSCDIYCRLQTVLACNCTVCLLCYVCCLRSMVWHYFSVPVLSFCVDAFSCGVIHDSR